MIYTKDQVLQLLEEAQVIIKVMDGYSLNMNFAKKIKDSRASTFCIGFPDELRGSTDDFIYKKVMEQCSIPLMHKGPDLSYFLRTQTKESMRILKEILRNPEIEYLKFINKTKKFYSNQIATPGFSNYLTKGTWRTVYDDPVSDKEAQREQKGMF